MIVFIDANLLFSAAYSARGNVQLLVEIAAGAALRLVTSDYAAEEATRNLALKAPRHLDRLAELLRRIEVRRIERLPPCPVPLRAKDQPIVCAALALEADVLLTGDVRDFGPYFGHRLGPTGLRILRIGPFLKELLDD